MEYSFYNIRNITKKELKYWYNIMSIEKQQYVNNFVKEDDKIRSICGEMLARKEISRFCDLQEEKIEFSKNDLGKPIVKNIPVEFNISHSGDMVACVVSNICVGIDIEKIDYLDMNVAKYFCSQNDIEYIYSETKSQVNTKLLYEIWTAKEAWAKCYGIDIDHLSSIDYNEIRLLGKRFDFQYYTGFVLEKS